MASKGAQPNLASPGVKSGKKITTNEFHSIRERELRRKIACDNGAPATTIPGYFMPSLRDICANVIASTFKDQPSIEGLKDVEKELYDSIMEQLPTDLELEVSVPRVKSQDYWRACCCDRWKLGELTDFTRSKKLEPPAKGGWKRVYLERNLEEYLMGIETPTMGEKEEERMVQLCTLCGADIYGLRLTHQRCHFDIFELFSKVPHLEEFELTYGVLNANIKFRMDMLKMKQPDALGLQKVLRSFPALRSLALPGNGIDTGLLKALCAGLVKNTTLALLDLSHNAIDDDGAVALGTLLMKRDLAVTTLLLGDNQVRQAGARAIGRALSVNTVLVTLSLKMNRLTDAGGQCIIEGLRTNKTLESLDVSTNEIGPETARTFADILRWNTTLRVVLASGNAFQAEGGRLLLAAAEAGASLLEMDVRHSGLDPRDEEALAGVWQRRLNARHMEQVEAVEGRMRQDIQRLVAEKVRRTHGV